MIADPRQMTAESLDGKLVRISNPSHAMCGFIGEAVDRCEHGWIDMDLSAVDIEDERYVGPLLPSDVEIVNART